MSEKPKRAARSERPPATRQVSPYALFWVGVALLSASVTGYLFLPELDETKLIVLRTVLAISVAAIGASIPGVVHVRIGRAIRAGGAIALFLIVYFYDPATSLGRSNHALERQAITEIVKGIQYKSIGGGVAALGRLRTFVQGHDSPSVRAIAFDQLKTELQKNVESLKDPSYDLLSLTVRRVRAAILSEMLWLTKGNLASLLEKNDLQSLDLFGADLRGANLSGLSLKGAFLADADLSEALLDGADLSETDVRGAHFGGASLKDADLTEMDWYDANGFRADQLRQAKTSTIEAMPGTLDSLQTAASAGYALDFRDWSRAEQDSAGAAWRQYLQKGGLHDLVSAWRQ